MAGTLHVYGNSTLRLLGLEDARVALIISIREDVKQAFDCGRESCEIAIAGICRAPRVETSLGQVPPRPSHARGQDFQDVQPAGGCTQ
jgi:hypothetical protein